ncbi:dihydrofolate reductase family protein [Cupriavidus sp. CP313]
MTTAPNLRFSVFIATSLDGFIARADGDLDWLLSATTSSDDHGYAAYMQSVDTLLLGRNTYEKVLTFDPWPYAGKRVMVMSNTLAADAVPPALADDVRLLRGTVREAAAALAAAGATSVYVDGGKLIQSFLADGLIDTLTITRIPVLIGHGIALFGDAGHDIQLAHLRTTTYESGFVQSTYRVVATHGQPA